jgi:transposase
MRYDEKFREKAVRFKDSGHSFAELKEFFGISYQSYYDWKKLFEKTGKYAAPMKKHVRSRKIDKQKLVEIIELKGDSIEQGDLAKIFGCSQQAISKALKELKITRKKRLSHTRKKTNLSD